MEVSMYWSGTTVGDATLAPYDDDEFSDNWSLLHTYDRTTQGVIDTGNSTYSSMLACTNPAGTTIRVANGAALVDGKLYKNTANVDFSVTAPGAGTNYYTIVLQKDFVAQTVRLAMLGPDAVAFPTVTQTDGTIWEIEIWQITITNVGAITISDVRECIHLLIQSADNAIQRTFDGNARGDHAIDFQNIRSVATRVASGDYSFIAGGQENTASGTNSHAEGSSSVASGESSHAEGTLTTASGVQAHAEGYFTTASGSRAHAEGDSTTATANYSHAEGYSNDATGISSHAEGEYTTASGLASHAEGSESVAERMAQSAFASGNFITGRAQGSRFVCYGDETHNDDTWRTISIANNGATDATRMKIATDTAWMVDVQIVGTTSGCGKTIGFQLAGLIENDGGTTAVIQQSKTATLDSEDTDFDAQIAADNTNDCLLIQVKDSTSGGDTFRWVAVVRVAEVEFAA